MKMNNKTCICCGKIYTFCTGCDQYINEPRWKAIYHNETCKDIFVIVSDYLQGAISKEEAKERLLKCDLSYRNELHKKIQDGINEILHEEEKSNIAQPSVSANLENAELKSLNSGEPKETNNASTTNRDYTKMKYQNQKRRKN